MQGICKTCSYDGICDLPTTVQGVLECEDHTTQSQFPNKPAQRVFETLVQWRSLKRCEPCTGCYLQFRCNELEEIADDFTLMKKRAVFAQENSGE